MDRRRALYSMALATGGITLLARCNYGPDRLPIALNNLQVTVEEEDILKELVNVIIPATDIPGAEALEVHNFVWVMADDCMKKEDQEKFMAGVRGYMPLVKNISEKEYDEMTPEEKVALLQQIETGESFGEIEKNDNGSPVFDPGAVKFMLSDVKNKTIWGYMQSEFIMKDIMPYALVPGGSTGCATIDPSIRININA